MTTQARDKMVNDLVKTRDELQEQLNGYPTPGGTFWTPGVAQSYADRVKQLKRIVAQLGFLGAL
jgi:hypothetical protein